MENLLEKLFLAHFWTPIPFKRYQNMSGCGDDFNNPVSAVNV